MFAQPPKEETMNNSQANLIVTFVLLGSALVFGGIAVYLFFEQRNLEQNGVEATATVVEMIESRDSDGDTTYAPVFEFRARNGRVFRVKSGFSSYPPEYQVGERVTILYLPESPENAEIKGSANFLTIVFGGVAVLDLAILLWFLIKQPIGRDSEPPPASDKYQSIEHF